MFSQNKIFELIIYIDFDWVIDLNTWQLTTGYLSTLAGGLVGVSSKCQHWVILVLTEAEYVAYCQVIREMMWL